MKKQLGRKERHTTNLLSLSGHDRKERPTPIAREGTEGRKKKREEGKTHY